MAQDLVFVPLGGVGEVGMNAGLYGLGEGRKRRWLMVDCGVTFGDPAVTPGIDLIMPDIRFAKAEKGAIEGLILTHAHEDHYGALLDLWPMLKCPVYATPFAAALLEAKRAAERNAPKIDVRIVPEGARFNVGPFDVELVPVAHSIPESTALAIRRSTRPRCLAARRTKSACARSATRAASPSSAIRPTRCAKASRSPRRTSPKASPR